MSVAASVDAIRAWRERNPLRVWRQDYRMSIRTAASLIGTNMNSVIDWEQGQYRPSQSSLTKIAQATDGQVDTAAWDAWESLRPS